MRMTHLLAFSVLAGVIGLAFAGDVASPEEEQAIAQLKKSGFFVVRLGKDKKSKLPAEKVFGREGQFNNETLKLLGDLKKLKEIDLQYGKYTDAGFEAIKDLSELSALRLNYNLNVKDDGLVHLAKLDKLEQLWLKRVGVTDAGLKHVAAIKNLTWLNLEGAKITGAGLAALKPLTKLKVLNLTSTTLDDDAMKELAAFTELETLQLPYTKVTDKGLAHLAGLTKLKHIDLAGTKIDGSGLIHLKNNKLTSMFLWDTPMTDAGLKSFAEFKDMKGLEEIRLTNNKGITDRGLVVFEGLPQVRYLFLTGTSVTEEGKANLKMKQPKISFPKF